MKEQIQQLISKSLNQLLQQQQLTITEEQIPQIRVERCKDKNHGDFAANIAMMLAKAAGKNPREIARLIVNHLEQADWLEKVDIAGPGFINFSINKNLHAQVIDKVLQQADQFGFNDSGAGEKILLEYVSANPTGPLHVGHGRGAAYGASLANLLRANGYQVDSEYYVNDAGRQMDILATSVWLRFLQKNQIEIPFPANAYRGDYIYQIVEQLDDRETRDAIFPAKTVLADLPADEDAGGDKEIYIDAMIQRAKKLLGSSSYAYFFRHAIDSILADIKDDLQQFGVNFDNWYSEQQLMDRQLVGECIDRLEKLGHIEARGETLWFRSSDFGDDKDRVVQRENGQTTYFASDIAYHMEKYQRGYNHLINIWGADHHGYVARVKAAIRALNLEPEQLQILLVQFAVLYRDGKKVQMSTRSGSFVTLRELREDVGNDAARFFYVMRRCEQHLDFDIDLAKSKTSDNPVYYIQYAHARICSVINQLQEKQFSLPESANYRLLNQQAEQDLMVLLSKYPELIHSAGKKYEPHLIAHYLRELAAGFHAYYNQFQFIIDDEELRNARIRLIQAIKQVIANGLKILGVSAPRVM